MPACKRVSAYGQARDCALGAGRWLCAPVPGPPRPDGAGGKEARPERTDLPRGPRSK